MALADVPSKNKSVRPARRSSDGKPLTIRRQLRCVNPSPPNASSRPLRKFVPRAARLRYEGGERAFPSMGHNDADAAPTFMVRSGGTAPAAFRASACVGSLRVRQEENAARGRTQTSRGYIDFCEYYARGNARLAKRMR